MADVMMAEGLYHPRLIMITQDDLVRLLLVQFVVKDSK
jgi:hypothetical protein